MSTQRTTPPQPSHQYHSHHCPTTRTLFPLMFPSRLAMIWSHTTLSWQTMTKEQLAKEMWTCKDLLCHTPHHQTPMGYPSTPGTLIAQDTKSCHQGSSEHGSTMTLMPHHYTEVSPHQLEVPDLSPCQHPIAPHFVIRSPLKDAFRPLHTKRHQRLPTKGPQKSRHCLAEDAAHALLLGVLYRSHPYSLKYQSLVQSPPQELWEKHPLKTTTLATMPPHQEDITRHLISQ
jgi:hypothetical protein